MAKDSRNTTVARQVEIIIRRLESLSTLPEVAAGVLANLIDGRIDRERLALVVESDPALTARIFSIAYSQGLIPDGAPADIPAVLAKLPRWLLLDAILSVKVFQVFDFDYDPDNKRILPRKQLALHALAVACCARDIAELSSCGYDAGLAFSAGLLHDIGKLALDEVMPKSFERLVEEARDQGLPFCQVEREHLGLDHTILGKRLAEKWLLPEEIVMAIWLHHTSAELVWENMASAGLAPVVCLADIIARQCGIGISGSFEIPQVDNGLVRSLGLTDRQVERIRSDLAEKVSAKSDLLGLNVKGGPAAYCELVQKTAATLSKANTELSQQNLKHCAEKAQMDFVTGFLAGISVEMSPHDVAGRFAAGFQKHYQTGPVCVCLTEGPHDLMVETIAADSLGSVNYFVLNRPAEDLVVPKELSRVFSVIDAAGRADWIIEQLNLEIDLNKSKMMPLLCQGRVLGVLIFQQRLPSDACGVQTELFAASACICALVLAHKYACRKQGRLCEDFAAMMTRLRDMQTQLAASQALAGLAEMAAGAAHELNNPLAVISGRAQLLCDTEQDKTKKQMLKQIKQRTDEISEIVTDLLSFARPKDPQPAPVSLKDVIDQALAITAKEQKLKSIEAELVGIDSLGQVLVDRNQIVSALYRILSNAVESYSGGGGGPVLIKGDCAQARSMAVFEITDYGCGMDSETLSRAAEPFFSAKPAGRKRGMGLAHAKRLLTLNGGSFALASTFGKGTTVTIRLPKA